MPKKVLITGASKGIGSAIAEVFKKNGFEVLTPSHAELDLSSNESVDKYLSKLSLPIDILINNAGINPIGEIVAITDENIESVLRVNLVSPIRLIRGIVPSMIKRNYGRILNISSIWSVVAKQGRGIYAASKSGLNAITQTLAVELAKNNILVNSISPGFVNTELTKKNNTENEIQAIKSKIPHGRLAEASEIAELALFLCSDKNTFVTGQNIIADGGYSCL